MNTMITQLWANTKSPSELFSSSNTATVSFQSAAPYLYTAVGIVGLTLNMFVMFILATGPTLKKRMENSLLFNQSLCDGAASLFLMLNLTNNLITSFSGIWGEIMCKFWIPASPLWAALQASVCNHIVITIERYLEIVHPIFYKRNQSRRLVWAMVLFPWIFCIIPVIPFLAFKNGISQGKCIAGSSWPNLTAMKANGIVSLCIKYIIPLVVFIFCYTRMIFKLKKVNPATSSTLPSTSKGVSV